MTNSSRTTGSDATTSVDPRRLAEALGMTEPAGAIPSEPLRPDPTQGGRLRLDKCGALEGQPKLTPVRAHERPSGAGEFRPGGRQPVDVVPPRAPSGPKPKKATLPPKIGSLRPPEAEVAPVAASAVAVAPESPASLAPSDEVWIPEGAFLFGEDREMRKISGFWIDRLPVTHGEYAAFVRATGHRTPPYWPGGQMPDDLRDHPVVGVDYFDALAYAQWKGKDLPYEDEWERAARGTDGRTYPWGNDPEMHAANTARSGLKMTLPVGYHPQNVSPEGARDLVGNAWEVTHSPAPGGGIVVRGGSWYDFALYAKSYFRFAARVDARNGTIGFRCVRRSEPRLDAPREVDPARAEAEIRNRRGTESPPDFSRFSPERRDLVPDYRRLRNLVAERPPEPKSTSSASQPTMTLPSAAAVAAAISALPKSVRPAFEAPPEPPRSAVPASPAPPRPAPPTPPPPLPPPPALWTPAPAAVTPSEFPSLTAVPPPVVARAPVPPPPPPAPMPAARPASPAGSASPGHSFPTHPSSAYAPSTHAPSAHAPSAHGTVPGVDRTGLRKAAESAAASRTTVTTPSSEPTSTPFLWWALLGVGVLACLALLGTLIANLLSGGGGPDVVDEIADTPEIERGVQSGPFSEDPEDPEQPEDAGPGSVPENPAPENPAPQDPAPQDPAPQDPAPQDPGPADETPTEPQVPPATPPVVPGAPPDSPANEPAAPVGNGSRPGSIAGLPEVREDPGDSGDPRLTDGAAPGWDGLVRHGSWILVFAVTPDPKGYSTIRAANNLHRRLRDTGVEVLIVLSRKDFQDAHGALLPADVIESRLKEYGATSDVRVVLDPASSGTAARTIWRVKKDVSALWLKQGREEGRTSPPEGSFTVESLAKLVLRALEASPSAVPR